MRVIAKITGIGDSRFKSWIRDLIGIDKTKTDGYAFLFTSWYREGRKAELEVGTLLLRYGMEGSRKYAAPVVDVVRVDENGLFEPLLEVEGMDWALDLRDRAADLLEAVQKEKDAETRKARELPMISPEEPQIREEVLSDGSKVYGVVVAVRTFDEEGRNLTARIVIGAMDKLDADAIRSSLQRADSDLELPEGFELRRRP